MKIKKIMAAALATLALSSGGAASAAAVNGYIGSPAPSMVLYTGTPKWVQIHSTGSAPHFSNLSTKQISILRIHNAKVLKTTYSEHTQTQRMNKVQAAYPGAALMNASAFNGPIAALGLQINNGMLFNDWNGAVGSTYVINKNGSFASYTSATPISTILKNGAAMSFSYGTLLISNGKTTPNRAIGSGWQSFAGNDAQKNLYQIVIHPGTSYGTLMATLAKYHLQNLITLDAAGSSQLALGKSVLVKSSDSRPVADWIVAK